MRQKNFFASRFFPAKKILMTSSIKKFVFCVFLKNSKTSFGF